MALAAAAAAPSAWAAGPQDQEIPPGKTAASTPWSQPTPTFRTNTGVPDAVVEAGVTTDLAFVGDCALPYRAPVVWARADHGTIIIKKVTRPNCGRASVDFSEIFYTSKPGFRGVDKVYLLGFLMQDNIDRLFTVVVK